MKKYLVTGGAGFIGSNFIHYMLEKYDDIQIINLDKLTYAGNLENLKDVAEDHRYTFVQGDICDRNMVLSIFDRFEPDVIVNFAAESHVDRSISDPSLFEKTNVGGTLNLLNCAKERWFDGRKWKDNVRFHQVSTDEVYGALGDEGLFSETSPLDPHSPYSASKASADLFVKAFFDTYGMPVSTTRCSNNYGAYQFPEKMIPLVINNCIRHEPIPIYGDGLQIRDWLYVKDHCSAIDLCIKNGAPGQIFNVGGNNEKSNLLLVQNIINILHEQLRDDMISSSLIIHVEDRPGHDRRYGIDSNKLQNVLGWHPETTFETGLELTVKWYLENESWMKNVISGDYMTYYDKMYKTRVELRK